MPASLASLAFLPPVALPARSGFIAVGVGGGNGGGGARHCCRRRRRALRAGGAALRRALPARAVLTVRRGAYDDARPAARCMADVFRALERPPAAVRPIVTHLAYLDMVGQLSRRLGRLNSNSQQESRGVGIGVDGRSANTEGVEGSETASESAGTRLREPQHVLLVAEDHEKAPGIVIGCIEMGVVNVPRLLTKGILDEIEQWGEHVDGEEGAELDYRDHSSVSSTDESSGCRASSDGSVASIAKGLVRAPYIGNLAVSTEFRRLGIGSRLVREAEEIARGWGFDRVCLHVDAAQPAAKAMYARLGYECVAQEPAWHADVGRVRRMFLTKRIDKEQSGAAPTEIAAWDQAQIASSGRKINVFEYLKLCIVELKRAR